jgi:hypothetical protein
VNVVCNATVVIDAGRSVENHVAADTAPGVGNRAGAQYSAGAQNDTSGNSGGRVYKRSEAGSSLSPEQVEPPAGSVVANRSDQCVVRAPWWFCRWSPHGDAQDLLAPTKGIIVQEAYQLKGSATAGERKRSIRHNLAVAAGAKN